LGEENNEVIQRVQETGGNGGVGGGPSWYVGTGEEGISPFRERRLIRENRRKKKEDPVPKNE